ncbi:unnamed protein product [Urochloa decumbens]|uniref:Uncharacterized protein n=1 Tax=Urochloa decumbens TaxID=240449 RepID=A0ABC9AKA2_9POAL
MPNSSGSFAGDASGKTTIFAEMVTGSHVLEIKGYSGTKGLGVGEHMYSGVFGVAGHMWSIAYCPDGFNEESANYISIFVKINHPIPKADVKARFCFSLLNHTGVPVPKYTLSSPMQTFSTTHRSWGYRTFIERKELESSYLKDDSFQIKCDLTVVKGIRTETTAKASITVPPPDLQQHLGDLFASKDGGDVTFEVEGKQFRAHRYILAARSSVFKAELFGSMKEKTTGLVRIHDMDVKAFYSMLYFIYTDSFLETDECDKTVMAQHLLVAADRYNLKRLKLICEDMLCSSVDISIAATTLVLAEQHECQGLKDACFNFLKSPGNIKALMANDGFQHLKNSCPALLDELLAIVAP